MFLKYLTVKDQNGSIIRHVDFKIGVNIIKGIEACNLSTDKPSSTNSIGKTTILRCIDFCLCGEWQQFIFDKEFKASKNNTVFDFFKENLPIFELCIVNNLEHSVSATHILSRSLTHNARAKSDKSFFSVVNSVNGNKLAEGDYQIYVKEILFNLSSEKPSIRQLIPKFIRTSDHQISNIVNYLPFTSNADYELLHLFLFDFNSIQVIREKIVKENEIKNKLLEVRSFKEIVGVGKEELNAVMQGELAEKQKLYNNFKIDENYKRENDLLNIKQEQLNYIKADISKTNLNIEVWQRRLNDLALHNIQIDAESIEYMYQEADLYNANIQKKYEETILFHQSMLKNEVSFILNSIEKSIEKLTTLKETYSTASIEYSYLLKDLGDRGSLAEFTEIGNRINHLTKEIAENDALINKYKKSQVELSNLNLALDNLINLVHEEASGSFRRKLTVFNRYFLEYSKDLSDDGYYLATYTDKKQHINLVPMPQNKDSHTGDGRKQSLVIAFDLAYAAFSNDNSINIKRPSFFTQDKVEIVDKNMLDKLISLVNSKSCQFIFPIISDKLEALPDFDEKNVILTLSENNKFFDIENYRKNL